MINNVIAFNIDDKLICASCFYQLLDNSDFPQLLIMSTSQAGIDGNKTCPDCGNEYLRQETKIDASNIINHYLNN
jgi:hypothetical protein